MLLRQSLSAGACAIVVVLALQPLFVAALALTRSHADLDAIRAHITQAFADGIVAADERPQRFLHSGGHQFTECTGLLLAIDDQPDLLLATLDPHLQSRYSAPCAELQDNAAGRRTADRTSYARYWHGYRTYLWPMLSMFSLETVRYVNVALLYSMALILFFVLRSAIGATPAASFFVVLISLTDIWRMANITTHALSTAIILAGAAIFACLYRRSRNLGVAVVTAACLGAVFNFVDFLINPPLMPMLLAFIVLARELERPMPIARQNVARALSLAFLTALAWFGGYGLTWASEWVLVLLTSPDGHRAWALIVKQIALRLYGVEADAVVPIYPLVPTLTMIVQAFLSVGSAIVALFAATLFVHLRMHRRAFDWRRFLLLSSPTLIPMVWFETLNNHTQTHSHFTYRSESAAIAIVFAAAMMATGAPTTIGSLLRNLWLAIKVRKGDAPVEATQGGLVEPARS